MSSALSRVSRLRIALMSAAVLSAAALAGCQTEGFDASKHLKPLSPATVALIDKKGMTQASPVLIRIFKEESELEVWKKDTQGQYALLKTYPICRWSGELGPKQREGDRQAPEGFYTITPGQMNPKSAYYLSFNLGYPNAYDRAWGRTGAQLMVHGDCSSAGCYSMTDEQIGEIYALGREAFFGGQRSFQVQAYPFRMTALNMARHRNSPHMAFWKMIKQGNDHFLVSRQEPKVDVCEKHYVFDAEAPAGASFRATEACPAFTVPESLESQVLAKTKRDEAQLMSFAKANTPTVPVKTGRDGGMHPVFLAKLKGKSQEFRDDDGNLRTASASDAPGTIPDHVNPPKGSMVEVASASASLPTSPSVAASEASVELPTGAVPMPRPVPGRSGSALASARPGAAPAASGAPSGSMFTGLFKSAPVASVTRALGAGDTDSVAPKADAKPATSAPTTTASVPTHGRTARTAKSATDKHAAEKSTPEKRKRHAADVAKAEPPASARAVPLAGAQPVVPAGSFENRWPAAAR